MTWTGAILADVRHAARAIRGMPLVATVVVLSIAFGVGANTVVFSWIQALVLRPIPGITRASDFHFVELVTDSGGHPGVSWPEYRDLRSRLDGFEDLLAFRMSPVNVGEPGRTDRVFAQLVSGNYFEALGLDGAVGRLLIPRDAERPGGEPVVVLSHDYWQARLAGDPRVLGRTLRVNGRDLLVVGVAPERFQGTVLGLSFDLWVPATLAPVLFEGSRELEDRDVRGYAIVGRLERGVSTPQAQAAANATLADLTAIHPETLGGMRAEVLPFWQAPRGPQRAFVDALVVLQGVMALLLLVVCFNTANLLVARSSVRRLECAVRLALGARPRHVRRLVLTESLMLAAAGSALGVLLAVWGTNAVRAVPMIAAFPIRFQTDLDVTTLGFAFALGSLCGLLFGAPPALALSRVTLRSATQARGLAGGAGLRRLLVGLEVAAALVVLIVGALFLRGFEQARVAETGFDRDGVLLAAYDLTGRDTGREASLQFVRQLLDRVHAWPGVEAAAIASSVPLDIHGMGVVSFSIEGRARDDGLPDTALINLVTPGYFETLGIPILSGQDFADLGDPSPQAQAIVNDEFVRRFVGDAEPLGRFLDMRGRTYVVVGVVRTSRYEAFDEPPQPMIYSSYRDRAVARGELHVRQRATADRPLGPEIAVAVREIDPMLSLFDVRTMTEHIERNLFLRRIPARMFAVLGPLLFVLAATGIYAVVACGVAGRAREIGIRFALGATRPRVVAEIVAENMGVVAVGALAGWLVAAIAALRFVSGGSLVLPVFLGVPAALLAVSALACWLPARRAARTKPVEALRQE